MSSCQATGILHRKYYMAIWCLAFTNFLQEGLRCDEKTSLVLTQQLPFST